MTPGSLAFQDHTGQRHVWEPGGEPALVLFARLIDAVMATDVEDGLTLHAVDVEADRALGFTAVTALRLVGLEAAPDEHQWLHLALTGRDHALAIAGEFLDGDVEALDRRPWLEEIPEGQLIYDARFHAGAAMLDSLLLDQIGELTMMTDALLASHEIEDADFYGVPAMPWREITAAVTLPVQGLPERMQTAWRAELGDAHARGVRPDPVEFCRAVADRHLRFDTPNGPLLFGEPVGHIISTADGRELRVLASEAVEGPLVGLVDQVVGELPPPGEGKALHVGGQTFLMMPDPDGSVTLMGFDMTAPNPADNPTYDLSVPLAWELDVRRLAWRANALREVPARVFPYVWDGPVWCEPGWDTARLVEVHPVVHPERSYVTVRPVPDPDARPAAGLLGRFGRKPKQEEPERGSWLPAWQVLQRRPAAATALGLPAGVYARIEDDWVRVVYADSGEENRDIVARGPAWSVLRTVGWQPCAPTPWTLPDLTR